MALQPRHGQEVALAMGDGIPEVKKDAAVKGEEDDDDDWKWMDDDEWDNLWQNSVVSTSSVAAAVKAVGCHDLQSKRPPEAEASLLPPSKHLKNEESVRLWSDSNPSWLDPAEAAAALKEEDDSFQEEAFPAGQGFDLCTPIHPRTFTSTPMPPPPSDLGAVAAAASPSAWSSLSSSYVGSPWAESTLLPSSRKKSRAKRGAKPDPEFLATLSWSDLVNLHADLMAQKGKMDSRLYNKKAQELLQAFVLKSPPLPPSTSPVAATASALSAEQADWASEKEALGHFRSLLLSKKEMKSEELVTRVCQYIHSQLPPLLTADEKKEQLLKKSLAFVLELSPQVSLKTAPVIRSYVSQMFDSQLDNMFAEIRMPEMPIKDKALLYRRMFNNLFDDDKSVSFAATNKALLGKLTIRDLYFLTFYACVTSRRHRGDNLLQLGCVGK